MTDPIRTALEDVLHCGHIQDDGLSLCQCKVHQRARAALATPPASPEPERRPVDLGFVGLTMPTPPTPPESAEALRTIEARAMDALYHRRDCAQWDSIHDCDCGLTSSL